MLTQEPAWDQEVGPIPSSSFSREVQYNTEQYSTQYSTVQYSTVHCTGALPAQDPAVPHTEAAAGPGPEEGPAEDTDTIPGVAQETATATVPAILILI